MSNQKKYVQFCENNKQVLIFQSPQWLNAVVGANNWDVAISFKGKAITGVFPYVTSKRLGFFQVTMPILTYYLGPIIFYPEDLNPNNKISFKRKVITDLISQLPKTDRFVTQTDFDFDYWLPFYWKGFKQTTRYSYVINTRLEIDLIHANLKSNIKKAISKSEDLFNVSIGNEVHQVFKLHAKDYTLKGLKPVFTIDQLVQIDSEINPSSNRLILEATDSESNVVASIYLLKDSRYLHYMFGAASNDTRSSGVMSLLLWHAIQHAKKEDLDFNFGGSMNKTIEQYFSGFKGELVPYMRISKVANPLLKPFTFFLHR